MIDIQHIYKQFGGKQLFSDFSLQIEDGEFVMLTGESGCGKTTLLNMIGSLEPIDQGEILVNGLNVSKRKHQRQFLQKTTGFLFQNFGLVEHKTVRENLDLVQKSCRSGISAAEALEKVGLEKSINQPVYSLSGGEQQRVALARLMYKQCSIVLADEPTGSLDARNTELVMYHLTALHKSGKTIVMVTHNLSLTSFASRTIVLQMTNTDR